MKHRKKIKVSGVVQGVGFRYFVVQHARELGLVGWTRNNPDGSVEIEAEGSGDALELLGEEIRRGPRLSRVESVEIMEIEPRMDENNFRVVF